MRCGSCKALPPLTWLRWASRSRDTSANCRNKQCGWHELLHQRAVGMRPAQLQLALEDGQATHNPTATFGSATRTTRVADLLRQRSLPLGQQSRALLQRRHLRHAGWARAIGRTQQSRHAMQCGEPASAPGRWGVCAADGSYPASTHFALQLLNASPLSSQLRLSGSSGSSLRQVGPQAASSLLANRRPQ